jgi:hypothetical protein
MAKADVNNYRDSDTEQLLKLKRCVKVGHVFIEISYKLHKFIYLTETKVGYEIIFPKDRTTTPEK